MTSIHATTTKESPTSTSLNHESLAQSILQMLESHASVCQVQKLERAPATHRDLQQWEKVHSPLVLPTDLKSFYAMSDGFHVQWSIKLRGQPDDTWSCMNEILPIGNMHINTLAHIKRFKVNKFRICGGKQYTPASDADSDDEDVYGASSASSSTYPIAFDLDSQCPDGHVALIFFSSTTSGIYFQDLSQRWFFMARNFQEYMRLVLMHLGIPGWQYAFTDIGMTQTTKQWFHFLAPQRLAIDVAQAPIIARKQPQSSTASNRSHSTANTARHRSSNSSDSLTLSLVAIDELAESVISLQQKTGGRPSSSGAITMTRKKLVASSETDEEEE